ncbi:hypothetical protein [Andreprevotia sp. IGB-42]|uniref:hypothetical protein n=1 Tax=Andreprevotia sp. IGB-42 TaxID=2497473 RepID=UPI00135A6804|nr:hypothetical protein [Andreprevotia sp. IGB-42]
MLAVLGQPALACRQLVVFPEHLPANTAQSAYYVVRIEEAYPSLAAQQRIEEPEMASDIHALSIGMAPLPAAGYQDAQMEEVAALLGTAPPPTAGYQYRGVVLAADNPRISKGQEVYLHLASDIQSHCVFTPILGRTYLLDIIGPGLAAGQQTVLEVSPYGSFNLPSTHRKFDSYVRDIERMAAATAPTPGDRAAAPFLIDLPDNASFTLPSVLPPG